MMGDKIKMPMGDVKTLCDYLFDDDLCDGYCNDCALLAGSLEDGEELLGNLKKYVEQENL